MRWKALSRSAAVALAALALGLPAAAAGAPAHGSSVPAAPVPTGACARGKALESLGRYGEATTAYLKGLEVKATLGCSRKALHALDRSGHLCDAAAALDAAGRRKDAHDAYLALLKAVPASACAADGADATRWPGFWDWLGGALKDLANALIAIAAVLLLGGAAASLLTGVAARLPLIRTTRLLRWLRRPVLHIDDLDGAAFGSEGLGPGATATLTANVGTSGLLAHQRVLLVSNEAAGGDPLGGLSSVSSQAAAAAAFLTLVRATTPRVEWRVRGDLQSAGDAGAGLTLSLRAGRRYSDFIAFWEKPWAGAPAPSGEKRPAAETIRRLTVPAAAWLDHKIGVATERYARPTGNPLSWAALVTGIYWQEHGELKVAKRFYESALEFDEKNFGALANLGTALGEQRDFAAAKTHLEAALGLAETVPRRPPSAYDTNWYRVNYSLAVLYANEAETLEAPGEAKAASDKSLEHARTLLAKSVEARTALAYHLLSHPVGTVRRWWDLLPGERKDLESFLRFSIQPAALVLYASRLDGPKPAVAGASYDDVCSELKADQPNARVFVKYVESIDQRAPIADYNIACVYVAWDEWAAAAKALRRSVERTPPQQQLGRAKRALGDPTLEPLWSAPDATDLKSWLEDLVKK